MARLRVLSVVVGVAFLITPVSVPAVYALNTADLEVVTSKSNKVMATMGLEHGDKIDPPFPWRS